MNRMKMRPISRKEARKMSNPRTTNFCRRRCNSGSAKGWSALSRNVLEERFTLVVNMLRKVCSGRYYMDVNECRKVLDMVLSSE